MQNIHIVNFRPEHLDAFRAINLAWMERHWQITADLMIELDNPVEQIIKPGGAVLVALDGQTLIGSCALLKLSETRYELAKMCISDQYQGQGLGRTLAQKGLARANQLGASEVYLKTATALKPAIALYESLGFERFNDRHAQPRAVIFKCSSALISTTNGLIAPLTVWVKAFSGSGKELLRPALIDVAVVNCRTTGPMMKNTKQHLQGYFGVNY